MKANKDRELALEWWRSISVIVQINYADKWHRGLPIESMFKNWSFSMIDKSSSCIELIYKYLHA